MKGAAVADKAALAQVGNCVRARLAADPAIYRLPVDTAEIFALGGFVSAEECAHLMAMIDGVCKPSPVYDEGSHQTYRTSYSGDVDANDSFVRMIERRISDLLGIEESWGETMQGQRYHVGQEFQAHHDWFKTDAFYWPVERRRGGQRSWTAMIYLNNVLAGGQTWFPKLGIDVEPEAGALLMWNNALPDGRPNADTVHAARPVIEGEKYVVTKWFRTRRWS